jgi:AcrR family transcriptional regulator
MAGKKHKRKSMLESLTKQGIIEAAIKIITRQGVQGLTMDKVALEAGVAKGTLYVYFKDKEQLLQSVRSASFAPIVEELLDLLESTLPPDQKLEKLIVRHLGYFDEHRGFFRVLLYERQLAQAQWKRYQNSRYRTFVEKTAKAVEDGVRAGLFRALDPLKVAAMLIEANIAMTSQRLLSEDPCPVEEDARLLTEVFLHGVARAPSLSKRIL